MDIEFLRDYCLNKKITTESTPFDYNTLVFKVYGKIFCICDIDSFESTNLKCEPGITLALFIINNASFGKIDDISVN